VGGRVGPPLSVTHRLFGGADRGRAPGVGEGASQNGIPASRRSSEIRGWAPRIGPRPKEQRCTEATGLTGGKPPEEAALLL
jgi:hypothetical protein